MSETLHETPSPRPTRGEGQDPDRISPFCVHLCSKKAYFLERPPRVEDDLFDASGHTWCRLTMEATGPDDRGASPAACRAPRSCYRPYGSPPEA